MVGRPRKPTQLHIIHGNPGKRPLPKNEPLPTRGRPSRPGWLSPEAKREWRRVTRELEALGLLCKVDRALLVAYCETWAQYVAAIRSLRAAGSLTFQTETGYIAPRPEFGIAMKASQRLMQLSARFGFTPADRSKLAAPESKEDDPLAEFVKRGKAANE
jgi:P27 family predicted phage terminase small subunit